MKSASAPRFTALPIAALALLTSGCIATSHGAAWWQETVLEVPTKLGGCAVGDIDPDHPGNEIAVVASDGRVYCIRHGPSGWIHEVVAELPGEPIQCAIGDLDPEHPGDELVTVGVVRGGEGDGAPGVAYLLQKEPGGSWSEPLPLMLGGDAGTLLHAVAIGDADPQHPGNELVLAGFGRELYVLTRQGTSDAQSDLAGDLPGNAKGAAIGMGGVVVACDDGTLLAFHKGEQGWAGRVLETYPDALARVTATDASVLVSANDGILRLHRDGGTTLNLLESPDRLRGAVITDVDPSHPGTEMATAGYDGTIRVLWVETAERPDPSRNLERGEPFVVSRRVGRDSDRFHHLAAGELPGLGTCLVACGYSGRVIVVGHHPVP